MEDRYLFKGKEKDSGKWLEWNAIAGIPYDATILTDTICQCTGLKVLMNVVLSAIFLTMQSYSRHVTLVSLEVIKC